MKHLFNNGKAIIISGPQGSGKTTIARALAMACEVSYSTTTEYAIKTGFDCGNVFENRPGLVIIEEFSDLDWAKNIVTGDKIKIERRGRDPEYIKTPNFIFVLDSEASIFIPKENRRFINIEVDRHHRVH